MPLLISEKIQLSARQHSPDAFVGIIHNLMPFVPERHTLNLAYQQLIAKRTHLNVVFKKNDDEGFYKQIHPIPFLGIRELKSQKEVEYWCLRALDPSIGPLHEMALLQSKKLWIKKTVLYFKFSHLIFDGVSLFYFFKDLYKVYQDLLSDRCNVSSVSSDLTIYQNVMKKYLFLEKEDSSIKRQFWENQLKTTKKYTPSLIQGESLNISFSLSKSCVKSFFDFRKRHDLDALSIFTSLCCKGLQKTFDITEVRLRIASSFRHHLTKSQRCLLANLAFSFPLIINASHRESHVVLAYENREKIREMVQHLPLNPLPWSPRDFLSFSVSKDQPLTFALSCFVYRKSGFFTSSRQHFQWLQSLTDMTLMVGLSKESVDLCFSYNKEVFRSDEVKKLYQNIQKEIHTLK